MSMICTRRMTGYSILFLTLTAAALPACGDQQAPVGFQERLQALKEGKTGAPDFDSLLGNLYTDFGMHIERIVPPRLTVDRQEAALTATAQSSGGLLLGRVKAISAWTDQAFTQSWTIEENARLIVDAKTVNGSDPFLFAFYEDAPPSAHGVSATFRVVGYNDDYSGRDAHLDWTNNSHEVRKIFVVAFAYSRSYAGKTQISVKKNGTSLLSAQVALGGLPIYSSNISDPIPGTLTGRSYFWAETTAPAGPWLADVGVDTASRTGSWIYRGDRVQSQHYGSRVLSGYPSFQLVYFLHPSSGEQAVSFGQSDEYAN